MTNHGTDPKFPRRLVGRTSLGQRVTYLIPPREGCLAEFSEPELALLLDFARGMSLAECVDASSLASVRERRDAIIAKLGARNVTHAVSIVGREHQLVRFDAA